MAMSDLIDAGTMQMLAELDESAMPGRCVVYRRGNPERTPTGGTKPGGWVARHAEPMRCRFVASNQQAAVQVLGERLVGVAEGGLQLPLRAVVANSLEIDDDDEIEVTTTLPVAGTDYVSVARYKVVAEPFVGSYSTNLTVPVSGVK